MQNKCFVKRSFNLGPYEQLELSSEINEIPEELALDPKFNSLLKLYLFLDIERGYRKYLKIKDIVDSEDLDNQVHKIDNLTETTLKALYATLDSHYNKSGE